MSWFPGSRLDVRSITNRRSSTRVSVSVIHGVPVTLLVKEFGEFQDLLDGTDSHLFIPLVLRLMLEIYSDDSTADKHFSCV